MDTSINVTIPIEPEAAAAPTPAIARLSVA
jgi:hypothetical protein